MLSQFTRAGAKFIYGGFTSNVDMKSGAPAFGTPEYMKACTVGGQLGRQILRGVLGGILGGSRR